VQEALRFLCEVVTRQQAVVERTEQITVLDFLRDEWKQLIPYGTAAEEVPTSALQFPGA
jgi:hypothetical protein